MRKSFVAATLAAILGLSVPAQAQNFPDRPITMIIPFAAGGPTDVLGRVVAQRLSEVLGQQVVVENVGGAGGQTGARRVADAKPDGYTILLGTVGTQAQGQTLYKKPLYNSATDFAPIALVADVPIALIARKDFPADNLKDFIAYSKANAGKMTFGSAGAGSATHLGCVVANMVMGTDITHVPYRGTGPAMQDLQGGRIDFLCEIVSTAKPQIDGGTVKAIAIMTKDRSPALPNLPTAEEQGTKGMEAYTWNALFAPKGTPEPIIKKLAEAANQVMETPAVKERLQSLGAVIVAPDRRSSEYLQGFVKSEIEKWAAPIKQSGAQLD
jgi:tripartite-type tricarboxylate transporter receptor subunit TctC